MHDLSFQSIPDCLPPQNVDAEEAILGGILLDPEAISRVSADLSPQVFSIYAHQEIYRTALTLHTQGKPTDLMSVTSWLYDHKLLDRVGGQKKLAELVNRTVSAVNIDSLATLILDKYHRRQLIKAGAEIVQLGYETARELGTVLEQSQEKVLRLAAERVEEQRLVPPTDYGVSLWHQLESGSSAGYKLGWYDLEVFTGGLYPGTQWIVGAASSMGKTQVSVGLAHAVLTHASDPRPVFMFSLEMTKESLLRRMWARLSGISYTHLKEGTVSSTQMDKAASSFGELMDLPFYISDQPCPTVAKIRADVVRAIAEYGKPGLIIVDYLQLMEDSGHGNRNLEIGAIARKLRAIAKEFDVHLVLNSQLSRQVSQRNNKLPQMSDLRDSGEIEQHADVVILLHRDAYYDKTLPDDRMQLIVAKNRENSTGTATMLFDGRISWLGNMARGTV